MVQAPQSPSAQPSFVPVSRALSRNQSSTVVVGGTPVSARGSPFSRKRISAMTSLRSAIRRGVERALHRACHARRVPPGSSAASKALAIAGLLLPACTASPMTTTVCPGRASRRKLLAGCAPRPVVEPVAQLRYAKTAATGRANGRRPSRARFGRAGPGRSDSRRRSRSRCGRTAPAGSGCACHVGPEAEHHALAGAGGGHVGDIAREALLARLDLLEQGALPA